MKGLRNNYFPYRNNNFSQDNSICSFSNESRKENNWKNKTNLSPKDKKIV